MEQNWSPNNIANRPAFPVPSIFQTLLAKTLFEHAPNPEAIAAVAMASKSIQNCSLACSFASSVIIDQNVILPLFTTVFHPSTALSLQFVQTLRIHFAHAPYRRTGSRENSSEYEREFEKFSNGRKLWLPFCEALKASKYFKKSLRNMLLRLPGDTVVVDGRSPQDVESVAVSCLLDSDFGNLQNLDIRSFNPTDEDIENLNRLATVFDGGLLKENFRLTLAMDSDAALQKIAKLEKVSEFALHGDILFSEETFRQVVSGPVGESIRRLQLARMGPSMEESYFSHFVELTSAPSYGGLVARSAFSQLVELDLESSPTGRITDDVMSFVGEIVTLRTLDISSCDKLTDVTFITHLARLENLVSLNCQEARITDAGLMALGLNHPQLEMLDVQFCREITFNLYSLEISQRCQDQDGKTLCFPSLKILKIAHTDNAQFSPKSLEFIFENMPSLEDLEFHSCEITDAHFGNVGNLKSYPSALNCLIIDGAGDGLTDVGLRDLAKCQKLSKQLKWLTLDSNYKIEFVLNKDDDDDGEILLSFPNLTFLSVNSCSVESIAGIRDICRSPKLTMLRFGWCKNLGDEHLDLLTTSLLELETLTMPRSNLTSKGVIKCIPRLKKLYELDIFESKRVSDDARNQVMAALPGLHVSLKPNVFR